MHVTQLLNLEDLNAIFRAANTGDGSEDRRMYLCRAEFDKAVGLAVRAACSRSAAAGLLLTPAVASLAEAYSEHGQEEEEARGGTRHSTEKDAALGPPLVQPKCNVFLLRGEWVRIRGE